MKLLTIQCILFLIHILLAFTAPQYIYILVLLMIPPVFLLWAIACNLPIIGLLAAKFEYGKRLVQVDNLPKYKVDKKILTSSGNWIRVLHQRKFGSQYITWVIKI